MESSGKSVLYHHFQPLRREKISALVAVFEMLWDLASELVG